MLENVKRLGVILANVCPVPIYSGKENTVMQINQSTGLPYKDQGINSKEIASNKSSKLHGILTELNW